MDYLKTPVHLASLLAEEGISYSQSSSEAFQFASECFNAYGVTKKPSPEQAKKALLKRVETYNANIEDYTRRIESARKCQEAIHRAIARLFPPASAEDELQRLRGEVGSLVKKFDTEMTAKGLGGIIEDLKHAIGEYP